MLLDLERSVLDRYPAELSLPALAGVRSDATARVAEIVVRAVSGTSGGGTSGGGADAADEETARSLRRTLWRALESRRAASSGAGALVDMLRKSSAMVADAEPPLAAGDRMAADEAVHSVAVGGGGGGNAVGCDGDFEELD